MNLDRWRAAAFGALALPCALALTRPGTGVGGDTADYLDAARDLGSGRFPLGLPLLLTPVSGSMLAMRALMLAITLGLIVAVWWASRLVGGWRAATVAGVLLGLSRGFWDGSPIMSDRLGALLVVAALVAVLEDRPLLAGMLAGVSGWVRLVQVVFVAALPRRAWLPGGLVVAGLAVTQLATKGSLLGYDTGQASFALGNITGPVSLEVMGHPAEVSNLVYFPAVLLGWGGLICPLIAVAGIVELWRRRDDGSRTAALVVVLNLAAFLPYCFQSARFMLPAAAMLIVYAGAFSGAPSRPGSERESVLAGAPGPTSPGR